MIGQSSLTLRGSFFRFAFPALKDRELTPPLRVEETTC